MTKEATARVGQPAVTLYEVTASGIDQNWPYDVPNPNPVTFQKADDKESGDYVNECEFPFTYAAGVEYNECTSAGHNTEWCYTLKGAGQWGNCEPYNLLVANEAITASNDFTCSGQSLHVCSAQANYGGIHVDWASNQVTMSIFTPHEATPVAGSVTVPMDSCCRY
jgi:hypothetical protein